MPMQSIKGLTVTGLMRQAARYNARRQAVKHGDRTLTFAEA